MEGPRLRVDRRAGGDVVACEVRALGWRDAVEGAGRGRVEAKSLFDYVVEVGQCGEGGEGGGLW